MFSIDFVSKTSKSTLNFLIIRNTLNISNETKSTSLDLRLYEEENDNKQNFGYILLDLINNDFNLIKYSILTLGNFLICNIIRKDMRKLLKLKRVSIGKDYLQLSLVDNKWIHFLTDKYNYQDHNIYLSLNLNFD